MKIATRPPPEAPRGSYLLRLTPAADGGVSFLLQDLRSGERHEFTGGDALVQHLRQLQAPAGGSLR
jgi:hypothetical protein